ncbi:MAG: acyl-CoA dehydrogenase family protein [Proteobacteria bacterium]|nr:acyl-CoA dehydrogenase family protein [Pseudomonadota bacterium]
MDFTLDAEQDLIVQTVRKFADRDLRSWTADADRAGTPPERLIATATDLGFFDEVSRDDPASYAHLTRALRGFELGRGCAGLAALLETNVEPALAVATWGQAAAKDALFTSLSTGGLAAFAHDSRGLLTVVPAAGDLHVSGKLGPVPALAIARHVLVAAGGVLMLVPTSKLTLTPITPSGWRAACWATAQLDGVVVPADHVVSSDPAAIATLLAWARVSLAARAAGVATAAMEYAQAYAAERVQFGQPIGTFESLIRLHDDAVTGAIAARLCALHAAWALDARRAEALDLASRARVLAGDVVARATIDAVQIYGGYGFVNDYPVEKLMRDARAFEALHGDERLGRVLTERRLQEAV